MKPQQESFSIKSWRKVLQGKKSTIRGVLAIIVAILATAAGIYVGVFLLFVGGIAQIVDAAQARPVDGSDLAWGIVKIASASPVGTCTFLIGLLIAGMIAE